MTAIVTKALNTVPALDVIDGFEPLIKEVKASKKKIGDSESALDIEKEHLRALLNRFKEVDAEIREIAGIVEDKKPKRRSKSKRKPAATPRSLLASIAGGASRVIRTAKEAGKERTEAKRVATEKALACAKKKHNMSKLSPEVIEKIDASLSKHYGLQKKIQMKTQTFKFTLRDVKTNNLLTQVIDARYQGAALSKAAGFTAGVPSRALVARAQFMLGCSAKKPANQKYQLVSVERIGAGGAPPPLIDIESFMVASRPDTETAVDHGCFESAMP